MFQPIEDVVLFDWTKSPMMNKEKAQSITKQAKLSASMKINSLIEQEVSKQSKNLKSDGEIKVDSSEFALAIEILKDGNMNPMKNIVNDHNETIYYIKFNWG